MTPATMARRAVGLRPAPVHRTPGGPDAAFRDILDEALSIFKLPSARLELTLRVRRARPAPMRDLLLHAMVRFLHDRCEHAKRISAGTGITHYWRDVFPELPITFDDALLLAGPGITEDQS